MMRLVAPVASATLLVLVGCGGDPAHDPFVCPALSAASDDVPQEILSAEQAGLFALVETIDGFGGTYVHADQVRLVVLLVAPSDALANQARDALVEIYGERPWADQPAIAQKTEHDYAELWRYRRRGRNVMRLEEVFSVGNDHFTGVVRYGVEDEVVKACVEDNLLDMGIPATSFRVEVEGPISNLADSG